MILKQSAKIFPVCSRFLVPFFFWSTNNLFQNVLKRMSSGTRNSYKFMVCPKGPGTPSSPLVGKNIFWVKLDAFFKRIRKNSFATFEDSLQKRRYQTVIGMILKCYINSFEHVVTHGTLLMDEKKSAININLFQIAELTKPNGMLV